MFLQSSIDVLRFFGWWQLVTCFFAFMGLLIIWYHIGRKQKDSGQIWLALSILCWSVSGAVEVYYTQESMQSATNQVQGVGWRSIFSLLNSLFILLALPWFRYLPKALTNIIQSKFWILIVGLPFLFSLLPTLSKIFRAQTSAMITELDVYYSVLTLVILGMVLWESFIRRRLHGLAYLSILCLMIVFVAQVLKMTDADINQLLFSAIFKSTLIMIFFALALSWVKDLSEKLILESNHIAIRLKSQKNSEGKYDRVVSVFGVRDKEVDIALSPAHYTLLESFARKKKNDAESWLEIMPKGDVRTGKNYDIRDYNEVKRLSHKMLDELFGKGHWTKDLHELPFRDAFFERSDNRDRKIRLRLREENIRIDS